MRRRYTTKCSNTIPNKKKMAPALILTDIGYSPTDSTYARRNVLKMAWLMTGASSDAAEKVIDALNDILRPFAPFNVTDSLWQLIDADGTFVNNICRELNINMLVFTNYKVMAFKSVRRKTLQDDVINTGVANIKEMLVCLKTLEHYFYECQCEDFRLLKGLKHLNEDIAWLEKAMKEKKNNA